MNATATGGADELSKDTDLGQRAYAQYSSMSAIGSWRLTILRLMEALEWIVAGQVGVAELLRS
jgi:hypothetical protein